MLEWGFGIEKEFPIMVGTFTKSQLLHNLTDCLKIYDNLFLKKRLLSECEEIQSFYTILNNKLPKQLPEHFYLDFKQIFN